MRIVRRYLFRSIVSMIGLVLGVLMALGGFIEFVAQLNDIGVGGYGIPQALFYAAMKLPDLAFVLLPMATLLGSILGLGALAGHSEIIILRAAGISTWRLAAAVAGTGLALGLFTLVLGLFLAPPMDQYARQYRTLIKHGEAAAASGAGAWIRDGDMIIHLSSQAADLSYGGVLMFTLGEAGQIDAMAKADSAEIDDAEQWILNNYAESRFVAEGVAVRAARRISQPNGLSTDLLALTVVRPESLTATALYRYVRYLRANGLDAQRYEVAFWARFASAAAVVPMCVLALPFAFGSLRSSGTGGRMVVGVIVGLAYFLLSRSLADGGEVWKLDAFFVAWLPTLLLAAVTAVMVARTR